MSELEHLTPEEREDGSFADHSRKRDWRELCLIIFKLLKTINDLRAGLAKHEMSDAECVAFYGEELAEQLGLTGKAE